MRRSAAALTPACLIVALLCAPKCACCELPHAARARVSDTFCCCRSPTPPASRPPTPGPLRCATPSPATAPLTSTPSLASAAKLASTGPPLTPSGAMVRQPGHQQPAQAGCYARGKLCTRRTALGRRRGRHRGFASSAEPQGPCRHGAAGVENFECYIAPNVTLMFDGNGTNRATSCFKSSNTFPIQMCDSTVCNGNGGLLCSLLRQSWMSVPVPGCISHHHPACFGAGAVQRPACQATHPVQRMLHTAALGCTY
jgi:hypothetical protein